MTSNLLSFWVLSIHKPSTTFFFLKYLCAKQFTVKWRTGAKLKASNETCLLLCYAATTHSDTHLLFLACKALWSCRKRLPKNAIILLKSASVVFSVIYSLSQNSIRASLLPVYERITAHMLTFVYFQCQSNCGSERSIPCHNISAHYHWAMLGDANYSAESLLSLHIGLAKRSLLEANFGGPGAASSTRLAAYASCLFPWAINRISLEWWVFDGLEGWALEHGVVAEI